MNCLRAGVVAIPMALSAGASEAACLAQQNEDMFLSMGQTKTNGSIMLQLIFISKHNQASRASSLKIRSNVSAFSDDYTNISRFSQVANLNCGRVLMGCGVNYSGESVTCTLSETR